MPEILKPDVSFPTSKEIQDARPHQAYKEAVAVLQDLKVQIETFVPGNILTFPCREADDVRSLIQDFLKEKGWHVREVNDKSMAISDVPMNATHGIFID